MAPANWISTLYQRFLAPPVFEDQRRTMEARNLWAVLIGSSLVVNVFLPLTLPFLTSGGWRTLRVLLLFDVGAMLFILASRRGGTRGYAWLLISFIQLLQIYSIWGAGGVSAPGAMISLLLVSISGILLGAREAFAVFLFSTFATGCMLFAEIKGWLPEPIVRHTASSRWLTMVFYLLILVIVQVVVDWVVRRAETDALESARRRREAEEELHEREALYRRMFESMMEAYVRIDMQGRIVETNEEYRRLLGYSAEELGAMNFRDLTPERWVAMEENILTSQVLMRGYSDIFEKEYRCKDGSLVPVELRLSLLRDKAGAPLGMWAFVRDLTERRRAEQQLRESEENVRQAQKLDAIGQLAGGIAHDYNNILTAEQMQLSLLIADHGHDPELARPLEHLKSLAGRATKLTQQLLAFSRRQPTSKSDVEVHELLRNLLVMLDRLIGEHIRLERPAAGPAAWIHADSGMVEQVVTNLVVNARDALGERGGRIGLAVDELLATAERLPHASSAVPGRFICISVTDTGCGIPPEVRKRIFEPFFTTKGVGKGTGLGLATVFGIMHQHQGWVELESTVGQGSVFRVFFPALAHPPLPARREPASPGIQRGHETILLVEDDSSVRKATLAALRSNGYQVLTACNGPEALGIWADRKEEISLLLTDARMPEGMTGMDLAVRLREENPKLRVIITSGYSRELSEHGLNDLPDALFLMKPYELAKLGATVRTALAQEL